MTFNEEENAQANWIAKWLIVAMVVALLFWFFVWPHLKGKEIQGIPEKHWISNVKYKTMQSASVTRWQGSLLLQKPKKEDDAPRLIAVPSCLRWPSDSHTLRGWYVLNLSRAEALPLMSNKNQKSGMRVWTFPPPSLPQGRTRVRKYIEKGEPITVRIETLRIEVIRGKAGWVVRSFDKYKKSDEPEEVREFYFHNRHFEIYQEGKTSVVIADQADFRYFQGEKWLHLHYKGFPSTYGFPDVCQ